MSDLSPGYQAQSGKHLIAVSISPFDPERTLTSRFDTPLRLARLKKSVLRVQGLFDALDQGRP